MPPAYQSAAQTQLALPQSTAANSKAQEQRQLMYEQNKQKFLQKNFSFAVLQSENAMSVNNLASQ